MPSDLQKKKYFIIPGKNSTTKCLKSDLNGAMIPRDLLKHAKNEKVSITSMNSDR